MISNHYLIWAFYCLIAVSCNSDPGLQGANEGPSTPPNLADQNSQSDKSSGSSEDIERELDTLPPELIGGTYLTELHCGGIKASNLKVPKGLKPIGCGFYLPSEKRFVKVGQVKQDWQLKSRGRPIYSERLKVPANSTVAAAFLITEVDYKQGIETSVSVSGAGGAQASFQSKTNYNSTQWQQQTPPSVVINYLGDVQNNYYQGN